VNEQTKPATPRAQAARKPGSSGGTERERVIRALVENVRTARAAEQRLVAAARRRSDQFRAQRAAAVAGMREQGLTRADIAELTGLTFGEITAAVKAARRIRAGRHPTSRTRRGRARGRDRKPAGRSSGDTARSAEAGDAAHRRKDNRRGPPGGTPPWTCPRARGGVRAAGGAGRGPRGCRSRRGPRRGAGGCRPTR
jgi:hypothetical protein